MAAPLRTLLSETFILLKERFVVFMTGVVIFGVLFGGLNILLLPPSRTGQSDLFAQAITKIWRAGELQIGKRGEPNSLEQRLAAWEQDTKRVQDQQKGDAQMTAIHLYGSLWTTVLLWSIASWLLFFVAMTFYCMATLFSGTLSETVSKTVEWGLPFLRLQIWVYLRTFAWMPFVGSIIALVLGPRFIASQVIFVRGKKGALDSAQESFARTAGYWGKITGNLFVAGILGACVLLPLLILIATVSSPVVAILFGITLHLFIAYMVVFTTMLALSIAPATEHIKQPRARPR